MLQSIHLPFLGEMWILTADPVVCIPLILTEFPQELLLLFFFET